MKGDFYLTSEIGSRFNSSDIDRAKVFDSLPFVESLARVNKGSVVIELTYTVQLIREVELVN